MPLRPRCARHGNLAVALAESRNIEEARKHFELAIVILEKKIDEVPVDFETGALNCVQFLHSIEDEKGSLQVAKRCTKRLKKLLKK